MIPRSCATSGALQEWCRHYQERSGIVPQPPHIRFSIGVYQISQGMSWKCRGPVSWQSYCAAAMHFIMSAHGFHINMTDDLPYWLSEITEDFQGWDKLLLAVGKAQQQVCYSDWISSKSARRSRFDREVLRMRMYDLVTQCFSLVPPGERERACFDEMGILTKDIVIK